ncbi:hypothetical protein RclHR1_08510006 [Rhizophagus clarus]|uniref:Uncharacterized protein n=1 Tax=Rhizophagus clarus TaxID=94130 RepID=A0A2Z6SFE7_9GLOM|nr:hypothetical protein RclHR1_08510006 [Rhizophagus clarus]GES99320.1 hypothetical protein GLOIN_2v1775534 [Rhizophagus clarus]
MQDHSDLPMDKTENNFSNNTDTTAPEPQNNTFEFYLPLPNNTRIYYVTYTELNSIEIARLLNNRIDLSHVPNHQLPYHYNVQHLIRQQIVPRQQQIVGYQQNTISRQYYDTMDNHPISQEYSNNNAYNVPHIQQPVDYQQDTDTTDFINIQPTFQEYSENNAYDTSSISPNNPDGTTEYDGVQITSK